MQISIVHYWVIYDWGAYRKLQCTKYDKTDDSCTRSPDKIFASSSFCCQRVIFSLQSLTPCRNRAMSAKQRRF